MVARLHAEPYLAFAILGLAAATALHPLLDPDLGWHLRDGLQILASGHLQRTDFMSFTAAGQPWFANEWLWDIATASVHSIAGDAGLVCLSAMLLLGTLIAIVATSRVRANVPLLPWAAAALALANLRPMIDFRPAIAGAAFVGIFILLLERGTSAPSVACLATLEVLWANIHGSFPLGVALVAIYSVAGGQQPAGGWLVWGRSVAVTCPVALASLLNPWGVGLWKFVATAGQLSFNRQYVQAWRPLAVSDLAVAASTATLAGAAVLIGLGAYRRRHLLTPCQWLLLIGPALALGRSIEFLPFFSVAAAPLVPLMASRFVTMPSRTRIPVWEALAAVATTVWLLVLDIYALQPAPTLGLQAKAFPIQAVANLRSRPLAGPMFNAFDWGGYLAWAMPEHQVFVDSRTELFGTRILDDYLLIESGRDDLLDAYGINLVLIPPASSLSAVLANGADWQSIYSDRYAIAYQRIAVVGPS